MITLGILFNLLKRLARGIGQDVVERGARLADLTRSNLNLGLLALGTAAGLMDHDLGMGQAEALALGTARKKNRSH